MNSNTARKITDIPKPLYVNGQTLEITINPIQQFCQEPLRHILARRELAGLATKYLKPYADYTLYMEYSEPHVNVHGKTQAPQFPRVHVHGIVKFHNILGFLNIGWFGLQDNSLFTINFHDPEYWSVYCKKWSSVWEDYTEVSPLISSKEKMSKADLAVVGKPSEIARRQFAKALDYGLGSDSESIDLYE